MTETVPGPRRSALRFRALAGLLGFAILAACSSNPRPVPPSPQTDAPALPAPDVFEEGMASWYGPGFEGRATASGEAFDADSLTAAHRSLPFGSLVRVINLDTGNEVIVRINDRGPFSGGRIIDVSEAAARVLGMVRAGVARVRLILLHRSPPNAGP